MLDKLPVNEEYYLANNTTNFRFISVNFVYSK